MSFRKLICFVITIFVCVGFASAEVLARKAYESKNNIVEMTAHYNPSFIKAPANVVEVAIYDKETRCFWYERFIIAGDKDYMLSEFETNPDLNISHLLNVPIKDWNIDQYANYIKIEIRDTGKGLYPENYYEYPHDDGTYSYVAYSRTQKDAMRIRGGSLK